jgi:hypothetical protein
MATTVIMNTPHGPSGYSERLVSGKGVMSVRRIETGRQRPLNAPSSDGIPHRDHYSRGVGISRSTCTIYDETNSLVPTIGDVGAVIARGGSN